jgi:DNA-binding LacI/PurR family transcriptional regulator
MSLLILSAIYAYNQYNAKPQEPAMMDPIEESIHNLNYQLQVTTGDIMEKEELIKALGLSEEADEILVAANDVNDKIKALSAIYHKSPRDLNQEFVIKHPGNSL